MSAAAEALQDAATDPWLAAAHDAWAARVALPRRGTPEGDAPAWSFANTCAGFDAAAMARCLVQMGLRRVATVARGDIAWWPPEYWRPSAWMSRDACAGLNRGLRDSRVLFLREAAPGGVLAPPNHLLLVDVDAGGGEWRTASGGAFGEDWVALGAFCWRLSRGRAASRLVRICGYREVPRVGDLR